MKTPHFAAEIYPIRNLMAATQRMPTGCLKVARYILENPQRVASMSIRELARAASSNKTAVVRVSKLSGYAGYRDLRAALMENKGALRSGDMLAGGAPGSRAPAGSILSLARDVVKINIEALQDTLSLLNETTLLAAVEVIIRARHVFLVGFGLSALVTQDAYERLLKLQIHSSTCSDARVLPGLAASTGPDDVLFCVSYSGAGRGIIEALETAKNRQAGTITLTSAPRSAAAQLSDITLVAATRRTPSAAESVVAREAQLAIIDILCAAIALRKESEDPVSAGHRPADLIQGQRRI